MLRNALDACDLSPDVCQGKEENRAKQARGGGAVVESGARNLLRSSKRMFSDTLSSYTDEIA